MEAIARVFLIDGTSKPVRYDHETTVERVLQVVLQALGVSTVAFYHFALRLQLGPTPQASERVWLHPHLLLKNIPGFLSADLPISQVPSDLRLELRIRFVPQSSYEFMLTDAKAFVYLHKQVYDDFLSAVAWKVSQEAALELAALHTCREFVEKQSKSCLDHKLNIDSIDIDGALSAFIPEAVRMQHNMKPAQLRKQFCSLLKKYAALPHSESVLRSLSILAHIVKYDVEVFKASLGAGWNTPVDLLVGAEVGLSYRINEMSKPTRLCELRNIICLSTRPMDHSGKCIVQIRLSGSAQPLLITVANRSIAECLAHLLDGYQRMFNQADSVYKLKGLEHCESVDMKACSTKLPPPPINTIVNGEDDIRIRRESVTLKELIGGGQFGNVYKGILTQTDVNVAVAVKVCKAENEPADMQLILQEAHVMKNFKHEHIVAMIGVCAENPIWLILELAPLGELRQYLSGNKGVLSASTQVLFACQLSTAVEYLHSNNYVHRDIAARNALVSSPQCVKLSDFGLSRALDYDAVYTASRGKLPIKWLAPESILYRAFSMSSDVWMFGILVWEIFAWGVKPWQGVSNVDVVGRIEAGDRPARTADCPESMHDFLVHHVWSFEAHKRPVMSEIVRVLQEVSDQLKRWVRPEHVRIARKAQAIPVIRTNIETLPNLTLWRTMEEQRRQAEEDDRWLEEEDQKNEDNGDDFLDHAFERKMSLSTENGKGFTLRKPMPEIRFSSASSTDRTTTVSEERDTPSTAKVGNGWSRSNHTSFEVEELPERKNGEIRNAIVTMNETCTTEFLTMISGRLYGQAAKARLLIANDVEQLSKCIEVLAKEDTTKAAFDTTRREIVRMAGDLSSDADSLLEIMRRQFGPSQPTSPVDDKRSPFRAILSDC
ncbi:kin-32 [Pristionchus pacificus]|uniref:Kin-32 n=1 Tax=Pristionchus pacificus TaxID=54126 RepID=A0A2A6BN71_PRIPA|nr:kin-32 [Pristionchus pacificus]|eukprot:PDM67354.1 kin-32 [Pristionchus pacificus]